MPSTKICDAIVIGAGPGGYGCAIRLGQLKQKVVCVEKDEVGGVCPFGLKAPLPIYCDVSMKAFDIVVPAAGSTHSAVKIAPDRMATLVGAQWVDVCEVRT